jgi:hypothetical protein
MTDQPDAPEVVAVAIIVWISCIASLVRGVKVYRERKSWVNFLILRNSSGNLGGQTINLFGMSLGLFDGILAMRIFYVIGFIGMLFHFLLSVYRFQIFGTLLPSFIQDYLKVKNFAPVLVTFWLSCWIPITIHVTLEFARSDWFVVWTISMFLAWMLMWIIVDNVITIWSLTMVINIKKSVGKLSKDQEFCKKVCLICLGILLASDIFVWPEMIIGVVQSYQARTVFAPGLRRITSLSGSFLVFHISISFVYMHYIYKLIASKSTWQAPEPSNDLDKYDGGRTTTRTSHDDLQGKPNTGTLANSNSNHSQNPEDHPVTTATTFEDHTSIVPVSTV